MASLITVCEQKKLNSPKILMKFKGVFSWYYMVKFIECINSFNENTKKNWETKKKNSLML